MFRITVLSCVTAVVVALFAGPAPASAVGTRPPGSASRVVSVGFSSTAPSTLRAARSSHGCRRISGTLTGYNILRDPQWRFTMRAQWCWAAGRITYKYSDPTVESPGHFWSFLGWIGNSSSPGARSPWIRYRQARFEQCIPLWVGGDMCGHEAHPWMRFFMYGNGTWHIDHS
jgi:hypothetical protein